MSTSCDVALRQGIINRLSTQTDKASLKLLTYLLANSTYEEYQHGLGGSGGLNLSILGANIGLRANFDKSEFHKWQTDYKQKLDTTELNVLKTTTFEEVASRYAVDILEQWNKCIETIYGFGAYLDTSRVDLDTALFRVFWRGYPSVGAPLKVTGSRITGGKVLGTYNGEPVPHGHVLPVGFSIPINLVVGGTIQCDGTGAVSLQVNFDKAPVAEGVIPAERRPEVYDAVKDFSPSGGRVWSYGYRTQLTSALNAYVQTAPIAPGLVWIGERLDPQGDPGIVCNSTGVVTQYGDAIIHPPNMLNLHPGPNGEYSVLRWTSPCSGSFRVEADFQGLNSNVGTTSEVVILHNNSKLFATNIQGFGAASSKHFPPTEINVNTGDTLDFCVGYGTNLDYRSDSTGVRVLIT